MRILILNGPNLNMTGRREPEIYGMRTMEEIMDDLKLHAAEKGCEIVYFQSNYEGALIDRLQAAPGECDAVILNAGALTHYSYALRDAIACCEAPVAEVHMSDITAREPFRAVDVISDVCVFRVMGLGERSYFTALDKLTDELGTEE